VACRGNRRIRKTLKGEDEEAMEDEFTDVLAWLASLANVVNIGLEKAAVAKYNDDAQNVNKHLANVLSGLRSIR